MNFQSSQRSDAARERLAGTFGEPLFLADWLSAVFLHYEVPADELQREIPFELDRHDGCAYVSLVAFTLNRMRPRLGGRLAAWLFKPIASNRFLNVRTYVRHHGEPGIFFIREWLDNRLSCALGPWTFGLPYHFGNLDYHHAGAAMTGVVREPGGERRFSYRAFRERGIPFQTCAPESLDDFLVERYLAFTSRRGRHRFFRVWHPPWPIARVSAEVLDDGLVAGIWRWFKRAKLVAAHFSPGVWDVWMGRPQRIVPSRPRGKSHRLGSFFELP